MSRIVQLPVCAVCGNIFGSCGHQGAPKPVLKPCLACGNVFGSCGH